MQADYWDSTIFLGDQADEVAEAATRRPEDASDLSRRISHAVLFPQGRPGGWLVFLLALCALVVFQALRLRFA